MNDDAQAQLDRDDMRRTEPVRAEKPRGACTGCRSEYQLGTARSGEHKGQLVVRKHNSRTGPGLCSGAGTPPREPETEDVNISQHGEDLTAAYSPQDPALPEDTCEQCQDDPDYCSEAPHNSGEPHPDPFSAPGAAVGSVDTEEGDGSLTRGPWVRAGFDSECDGPCGTDISEGDEIRADGEGGWLCENCGRDENTTTREVLELVQRTPATSAFLALAAPAVGDPGRVADAFTSPAPASVIPDRSVSMQPEPDRDRWGRYLVHGTAHTRATTFAKAGSSTFSLNEWQQRMTIAGLVLRPDLMALAHGLDVKRDRQSLNSIASQAKEAAGQKVAANLGTAYHAFSERLDAGLITLADVPEQYRPRLAQFQDTVRGAGLTTRTEWIERSTAVRADQVSAAIPVAGTLDRIYQLPNGELVIGDLKTGADLSYGWGEIAVQLALYAHGVNTFGLFDWRDKIWIPIATKVRTDFAIVVHLPAGGDGCTLHKVDLVKGWQRAQVCGQVMAMQADKGALSHPFTPEPGTVPVPLPEVHQEPCLSAFTNMHQHVATLNAAAAAVQQPTLWDYAKEGFAGARDQAHLAELYEKAVGLGFHVDQLATLVGIGKDRLTQLAK